ncbi:MAG: hypothetical protein CMD92_05175 [Gammaproteobacteria bacterium]|nr:hypothetical protein [Gammaproteobacteria bacterium]
MYTGAQIFDYVLQTRSAAIGSCAEADSRIIGALDPSLISLQTAKNIMQLSQLPTRGTMHQAHVITAQSILYF